MGKVWPCYGTNHQNGRHVIVLLFRFLLFVFILLAITVSMFIFLIIAFVTLSYAFPTTNQPAVP